MGVHDRIAGVILAGGRSSRMLGPEVSSEDANTRLKPHRILAGQPLIDHVAERLRPQVACLLVNANDDPAAYRHLRAPVVADLEPGHPGPLAGLACTMAYLCREAPSIELMVLAPCDAPFLSHNLVAMLMEALVTRAAQVACPRYQGFLQPTFSLWRTDLLPRIQQELTGRKKGGIRDLLADLDCAVVDWPPSTPDPFLNINTPDQLAQVESLIATGTSA